MDYDILKILGLSLVATLIIEETVSFLIGVRDKKDLLLICLVNIMTNPMVVLSYYLISTILTWHPLLIQIPLEIVAVLVEAWYFKWFAKTLRHPVWFSILINTISYGSGLIINLFF